MTGIIHHIVLFRFRTEVTAARVEEVRSRFRALVDSPHPRTGRPYILSIEGGTQNSSEGMGGGFEAGFVVRFATDADRDHYVGGEGGPADQQHLAFTKFVGPLLADGGVLVFDFTADQV